MTKLQTPNPRSPIHWSWGFAIMSLLSCALLIGCEQVDKETLERITQDDPSFKAVWAKKQDIDGKIGALRDRLTAMRNETDSRIKTLQDNFAAQKKDADAKIDAFSGELEPERAAIREKMEIIKQALYAQKGTLRNLENTRKNLTAVISQQKGSAAAPGDMAKWQERLTDLDKQIEPLKAEIAGLGEKLRLLRLKLIALRQ